MFKQSLRGCSQIHDSTRDGMGLNIFHLEADSHPNRQLIVIWVNYNDLTVLPHYNHN